MTKALMFCILLSEEPSQWSMKAETISMHVAISECHMALTTHGFDNPNDKCFCVQTDGD